MKYGLWSDAVNFPSLPLMKLSSSIKQCRLGKTELITDTTKRYDIVYVSKTFNLPNIKKIPQLPNKGFNADKVIAGGSGMTCDDFKKINAATMYGWPLPPDVESAYPDYDLYPELTKDTAYGFCTRGCPNNCAFCIVSGKEGHVSNWVAKPTDFWRSHHKTIKLLDPNLLACKDHETILNILHATRAWIDFTQGLDARLITSYNAIQITRLKIKMVHFAFDFMKNERQIQKGLETFNSVSDLNWRRKKVYILTNFNTTNEEDYYRTQAVQRLGYWPDIRIYNVGTHNQFLTDLRRYYALPQLCSQMHFVDYVPRVDEKRCGELYADIIKGAMS